MVPCLVNLLLGHAYGKSWHVVKSIRCMIRFKANNNKSKKVGSNTNSTSHVLVHKRNESAELREEDVKEAIHFCKISCGC